ncbi:MAG TPA: hypothetical protein VFL94_17255 [Actinomycetales bacterium]|nr:hypothetical protein [Actinomycetales bacterium]
MRWLRRPEPTPPLPAQVREGLGLARSERVLAHATVAAGGWLVATTHALVVVDPIDGPASGPGTPRLRVPWYEVAEATWTSDDRTLHVRWVSPDEPEQAHLLGSGETYLPEVVRERVMSTYVLSQRVDVRGRRGVTVAVRRRPDAALVVQAVADPGVDLLRPAVAEQVSAAARHLRSQVGLPPEGPVVGLDDDEPPERRLA